MKKHTNKLFISFLAAIVFAGFLAPLSAANAAAVFNNNSKDYATLRVSNYTKNPGSSASWTSSVNADAGDVISFDIYFHNNSGETATQARVKAVLPTGNFTSASATGSVWAQNASLVSDSVSINLSSSQALSFIPGSVKWYPDQMMSAKSLLYGQNGSEIVSSAGLNIGDIAPGWATQGHVVFRAQVSNNTSTTTSTPPSTSFLPAINNYSVSNISTTSAVFYAHISPNNSYTTAWFEYGVNSSNLNLTTSSWGISAGSSSDNISSSVYYLSSNTVYYYRVAARNSNGTIYSPISSFITSYSTTTTSTSYSYIYAPYAVTYPATSTSVNSAVFNGQVNPNGAQTDAWFEYGTSPSYLPYSTYVQIINIGYSYTAVSTSVYGLSPNTIYYYRIVARNTGGRTEGTVYGFTTASIAGNPTSASTSTTTTISTVTTAPVSTVSTSSVKTTIPASAPLSRQPYMEISQTVRDLTSPNGNENSLFAAPGDILEYRIILKNSGTISARNIKVSAQLPSVFRYIDSSPRADFDPVGNILSWSVSRLNPGAEIALSFKVKVEGGLNSTVNTEVKAYIPAQNLTVYSNSAEIFINYQKPIVLRFKAEKNEVKAGDILNYSITVKNPNDYGLKNILLSIGLAENTDLQEADFPVSARTENNLLVDLGALSAGQEISKNFSVKVGDNIKDNDILTAVIVANYQDEVGNSQPIVSAMASVMAVGSANLAAAIFSGIGSLSILDWLVVVVGAGIVFFASVLIRRLTRRIPRS